MDGGEAMDGNDSTGAWSDDGQLGGEVAPHASDSTAQFEHELEVAQETLAQLREELVDLEAVLGIDPGASPVDPGYQLPAYGSGGQDPSTGSEPPVAGTFDPGSYVNPELGSTSGFNFLPGPQLPHFDPLTVDEPGGSTSRGAEDPLAPQIGADPLEPGTRGDPAGEIRISVDREIQREQDQNAAWAQEQGSWSSGGDGSWSSAESAAEADSSS
jgi:hypothetical protein